MPKVRKRFTSDEWEVLAQFAVDAGKDTEEEVETEQEVTRLLEQFIAGSALLAPHLNDQQVMDLIRHNFRLGYWDQNADPDMLGRKRQYPPT